MNKSFFVPVVSFAALMLGASACTPGKEDKPPQPKTAASTAAGAGQMSGLRAAGVPEPKVPAEVVAAAGPTMGSLPRLGPAPAWRLQDLAGKPISSELFKGKVVVVDFWATWCPPCRAEIPGYTELQKKYGEDGFVIVGVSLDQAGPDVVKQFAEKNGINYQLVMGDEAVVAAFGGVEGIPTTFLIDRSGEIRDRKIGAEETVDYEKKIVAVIGEKT